jgi:radical SAM protein with 4Fe4S-binding SPASM domain|tara:strand:- start:75 stop:1223 length:1149 start_codon:yes stop_codon:yes gene_type:complete
MENNFCIAPWVAISTDVNGSLRPCCKFDQPHRQKEHVLPFMKDNTLNEIWNGPEFKKLRQAFINGEKPNECRQCWDEQKAGIQSYREIINSQLDIYPHQKKRDFTSVHADAPFYIDLKLTNVCNLKCRMCGPMASSLIQKENAKEYGDKGNAYWHQDKLIGTHNLESFISWLPEINWLCFTGGEPFVGKENRELLQMIIDKGYSDKIDLHFNTNGMLMPDIIIKILKQFRNVSIAFSIDDIGERLRYHRHGADWETIKKNVEKVPDNMEKHVFTTINNYNIWYADEAYEELKKLVGAAETISYDFVYEPAMLSPRNLNKKIKNAIINKFKDKPYFERLIKYVENDGEDLTMKFHEQIKTLDKIRNENFEEVFPEWSERIMYW